MNKIPVDSPQIPEVPTERVSKKELAEIRRLRKEMEAGKERSFEEVFREVARSRKLGNLNRRV